MLICAGAALLLFAIIITITGRLTLSRRLSVQGTPARMVGVVMMLPAAIDGIAIGIMAIAKDKSAEFAYGLLAIEGALFALCLLIAVILAWRYALPTPKPTETADEPALPADEPHPGEILAATSVRLALWSLLFFPLAPPAVVLGIIALVFRGDRRWSIAGIVLGSLVSLLTVVTGIAIVRDIIARR